MLLHRKRPALVLSRILICILAGCTVWSCGAGTPQTDTQRLTALADDIVPAREPVRPPYELARYDLSLKECGSLEALTAQAIKRQKELETHWSALRSVEVGANAPLRAQQALLAYAFGEKTLDEIRAAVSAAGSQERLRLARLLLAECRFDEAVEELIALVREGTSDGDFALAVLARHHVEREELEKRASLVPLRHDLKTFMAECEKTPRYDGWLPVLRQSVLPRLPPKEPLEIAATEVVIPSDPDDWEPNSDLVLIRDFQNPRSELCNASLHSGSLSTAYLQTATNDLFLYREGKAAVFARRGLVAFKLHTRYHGPITFRLYSFPSRDEWNRVSAAVLATLKPERQWSETFTPLSSNNVAGVKTETVQVKELAPGHYLLTAEARYAPVLAGHPFVVSGASLYLRVASNQIVVAAVSRDEGKPLANTPVKVQVHSAMPGVAPETAEERADAPAFLYGLRGQPLPAQQNATPEQRAVAEKAHAAGMARYRAAPDTDMVMQGMSDENGLCTFNVDLKNTVHVHHVTAQLGTGDPVCATASYLHPREPEDHIKAVAWFAQPIYRPGNTAQFKGVVRRFNGLRVAPHDPRWKTAVHVQVKNTKAILWEGRCDTTSAGGFSGEFTIPSTAALGGYDLFVEGTSASPQGALRVEEFRIPTFRVLVTPGRYICHPGQDIAGQVAVEYFSGKPAAGTKVEVCLETGAQNPPTTTIFTDDTGVARFKLPLPDKVESRSFDLRAAAMDASGQTYTASAGIYVSPEHLDVRMSANPSIAVHGSTVEVEVSVKNSANAPVQHAKVRLERPELTAETGQDGRAVFKVKVPDKGDRELLAVRVEANNLQQSTSQEVRLVTQQADPVAAEQKVEHRYDRLSVHSAWCAAGEEMEVSLSVDTVSSAESTVLLFIENTRLLACRAVRVARGEHKVRIPTDIGFAPQCTIEVVLMTGSKSRTSTSVGYVTPKAKQLSLEITTDRRNYKPGDQCTAEAVVKDHAGLPVANAEISLGVVQEPLYEVAGDRTPNLFHELHSYAMPHYPVGAFEQPAPASHPVLLWKGPKYAWGYLDVLYDSWGFGMDSGSGHGSFGARYGGGRALMVSRHGGSRAVAGDECEAQVRRQFRTTAHWVASLLTDEDGRARCQFAFPDDITEWRFTARGLTADTSVGEVHVSRHTLLPIQAEIVLPRGLRAGDRITTAAVIYENAQVQRALTVDCGVGAQRVVSQVSLKPHGIARVDLPVPPQSEGEVVLGVTARDLNTQNADASERKLTVLPRGYTHAWRHFGEASAGGEVNLDFGSTTPDTRRVTIKLEAGFAGPVASALQELIQYPYGCVEQTMSRFMPATVAARAMKDARLTYSGSVNLERVLSEGVVRLTGFQHADGGWGWWKEDATNDLMTAYVLEGLTLCRRAGHVIPAGLTDRAEEYLFGKVEAGVCDGRQVGSIGDVDVGEFAAHALAVYLNAEPDKHAAHRARLADLIDARPLAAAVTPRERVLRLDTLRLLGRTDVARQELRTTLGNLKLDFSAAGNRRSLMTLATLLELGRAVDADNARWFTLGRQLIERRHGAGWGDTLATAAAVRGLSALLQPAGQTRGSLSVLADGKPVAQLTLGKPDQESVQLGAEITHAKRLVLRTEGDVTDTFWSMRVEGRSATPPPNPTQPVVTVRCEVLDPQNNLAVIPVNEKKQLQVQRGKTLKVRLACTLNASQTCVRLTFPRPCGVEMIRPPKFVDGIVAFEQRDDAIHFFISHWEAGNHSVEFGIRAEVSGDVFAPRPEFAPMYGNTPPVSVDAPDSWQIQP